MICKECERKNRHRLCGQMFREWKCIKCGKTFMHHNTATPKVCKECSEKYNLCENCGKEIDKERTGK